MKQSEEANDAYHRQQLRLAIDAAEQWGAIRPRRWLARYGGYSSSRGEGAKEINKAYKLITERVGAMCGRVGGAAD